LKDAPVGKSTTPGVVDIERGLLKIAGFAFVWKKWVYYWE
jgi:hypothetical protein